MALERWLYEELDAKHEIADWIRLSFGMRAHLLLRVC